MNLEELDTQQGAEEGREFQVKRPDGLESDMYITVRGADAPSYRAKVQEIVRRNVTRRERSSAESADDGIELLAFATVSWRGIALRGSDLPCTLDNAKEIYTRYDWLREQVDRAIGDRANFLPRSAASS